MFVEQKDQVSLYLIILKRTASLIDIKLLI